MQDIVAGIYEAGLNPSLWADIMPSFSRLLGDAGIAFGVINLKRGLMLFPEHNFSPDCLRGVAERYHTPSNNPGVKVAVSTAPLTIAPLESVVSPSELKRMDFYNDLMRPYNFWYGVCANVYRDQDHMVALSSFRSASAGAYNETETAYLASLLPHMYRSVNVFLRLASSDALARAGAAIINRLPQGIIVVDAAGRAGFVNSAAEAIIAENDGLTIRDGVLRAGRRQEAEQLRRLIAEAAGLSAKDGRSGVQKTGAMQISRLSMRQKLPLVVAPMRFGEVSARDPLAVSITISDPERPPETAADTLGRLYGFTAAEAKLAVLLLRGCSPQTAATELDVSINTVRTHIRHLLLKTETERLTDFVRRVMSGPGAFAAWRQD